MFRKPGRILGYVLWVIFLAGVTSGFSASKLPGHGITVQPVDQGIIEEVFQLEIVVSGLKRLGFEVKSSISLTQEVGTPHLLVAQGDADFFAVHWDPLHNPFFEKVGGDQNLYRIGSLVNECTQGYLIDKKTADNYHINRLADLKNPEIAQLFDADQDGVADLVGCHQGWGCYHVIESHLDALQLRETVAHHQDNYFEMIDAAIERYRQGQPILFYTWTPLWVSGVLVPGKDVKWLKADAKGDAGDTGFAVNTIRILANKAFIDANPSARRFFEQVNIPINDIGIQNLKIRQGENRTRDVKRHAREWIKSHQAVFDAWIKESINADR